jgi:V-type H+-transporting ATPase subunit C
VYSLQPEPKYTKKTLSVLMNHFSYLGPRSSGRSGKQSTTEEFAGEYQALMEQEFFDFVLYEVPWIVL